MNWLDFFLFALLAMSAFAGARIGIMWAAMAFGSLMVGWYFAGSVSTAAGLVIPMYTDSTTALAVAHVLIYVALLTIMLYAASRMVAAIKRLFSTLTFGATNILDRLGGFLLGLIVGLALVGAIVLVGARLTYQVDLGKVDAAVPGSVEERVAQGETVYEGLENLLASSAVIQAVVRLGVALPGNALGLAPMEFGDSLLLLEQALD